MAHPDEVLAFWLDEVGPEGWYKGGKALDDKVRDRFAAAWQSACDGGYTHWLTHHTGTLAYVILTDQFARNMFRDSPKAFASDRLALAAAKMAISRGWDLRIEEPSRQFIYMPLMHSENLSDQDRCVRLFLTRMPKTGANNLLHARAHRAVIRRFGRFPYRNAALSRQMQPGEQAFLDEGGYGAMVREIQQA